MDLTQYTRIQLEALIYRQMVAIEQAQAAVRAISDELKKRPLEEITPNTIIEGE